MQALHSVSSDGVHHTFYYEVEVDLGSPRTWDFLVWRTDPKHAEESPYQATFQELDDQTVQSTVLLNPQGWALHKGISEAVFEEAYRTLGRTIVSSRTDVKGTSEQRSSLAEAMWARFVSKNLARFDASLGRYVYLPPAVGAEGR